LIAIRLAATELLRRGSLFGDVHESSVAADGRSIFDWNADATDRAQLAVGSDDTLLHIATTPFSDHSIQCRLHLRPIVGRATSTYSERLGTPFDDQIRGFCKARATNRTRQSEGTTSRRDVKEAGLSKIQFASLQILESSSRQITSNVQTVAFHFLLAFYCADSDPASFHC
jgi:hypothetical protein